MKPLDLASTIEHAILRADATEHDVIAVVQ